MSGKKKKKIRSKEYLRRKMETRKRRRQQNHVYYESNCVICFKPFVHDRLTAMYCSQACRNKSRSFPAKFLESMYKKANLTLKRYDRTPEAMQEYIKSLPIKDALKESLKDMKEEFKILGFQDSDISEMDKEIERLKAQRRITERRNAMSQQDSTGFITTEESNTSESSELIDPEMREFKLDEIDDRNAQIDSMVLADEPCPDCGSNHHKSCNQKPKKYKIRKIGEKNG
jgi:hypothetical protein